MSYRGVHFALTDEDTQRVTSAPSPEELVDLICEDIEEVYLGQGDWAYETDKAWDPIHRCLGDGELLYETGPHPLTYAVLGGTALDAGEDYTACLTTPRQVSEVSKALHDITRNWLEGRFSKLCEGGIIEGYESADFDYVWSNFMGLRDFLARAAKEGRHVLFTVDA